MAILDHFLFRAVTAPPTYAKGVKRLGHGERLSIDPATGSVEVSQFDKIDYEWKRGSRVDYLDRLDHALDEAVGWVRYRQNLAATFSGGIDSTLLYTFLPKGTSALFAAPESVHTGTPDPFEYARRAAELLQLKLDVIRLKDEETWVNLESNIDLAGWPQRVIQMTMLANIYSSPAEGFVQGGRGDALFGTAGTRSAVLADRTRALPFRPVLELLARTPGGFASERAKGLLQVSQQMDRAPASPVGWAAGISSLGYTDLSVIRDAVGMELVTERYANRLDYAQSRLGEASQAASHVARHLELAHWIDYWCEDSAAFCRQLGLAHRKRVHMPFLATPLVAAAMTVPIHERYIRGLDVKHLLKGALSRRLPTYPVKQKKGITSMRMPPTYRGEDRAAIWEEYPLSSFIPVQHRERIASFDSPMSFPALTFAMLDRRVLRNPNLPTVSVKERLEFSVTTIHSAGGARASRRSNTAN
jgi:hypothetical protein